MLCRVFSAVLVAALIIPFFSVFAFAETDSSNDRTITVGYINYGGFIERDDNGNFFGYAVDYLDMISKYTGWHYEYVYDSFENLMEKVQKGEIDLLCQAQKTPYREENYLFSSYRIGVEIAALYVSEDNRHTYFYDDAASLDGMTVAMLKGSSQNRLFDDYAKTIGFSYRPVYYTTVNECFAALTDGRADGTVMGSLAGQGKDGVCVAGRFSSDPYYIITGRGNADIMEQINDALSRMQLDYPYFEAEEYNKFYSDTSAFSSVLFTREENEYISSLNNINFAVRDNTLPLSSYNDSKGAYGIFYDELLYISRQTNIPFSFLGFDNSLSSEDYLAQHPNDVIVGIFPNDTAQPGILLSDPIYSTYTALVGRRGLSYVSLADASFRVAIPKGYSSLKLYISTNYPKFVITEYDNTEACLAAVLNGKADYAAQSLPVVSNLLDNPHYSKLSIASSSFMVENYRIAVTNSEDNAVLISILNKVISSFPYNLVEQFTVNHNSVDRYQETMTDVIYKYRIPFFVISLLVMTCIALLVALNIQRSRNMSLLKKKNEQLIITAEKANRASAAKSEFLARMSHDIRTPLNAVLGYTDLARQELDNKALAEADLKQIKESGHFLLGLVNDVLDMSKIESGSVKLTSDPVSLDDFTSQIRSLVLPSCQSKNITLTIESAGAEKFIKTDKIRFKQIFFNLLSNSVKFTGENGHILLKIESDEPRNGMVNLCITVKDDGIGMSEEYQQHLFEAFSQERTSASGMEGSGLGLSIVKSLVTLMGGTIELSSAINKGTTFVVHIPAELSTYSEKFGSEHRLEIIPGSLSGKRILLCEDNDINAKLVRRLLNKEGILSDHSENGRQCIDIFSKSAPFTYSAILMDIRMPVMDGIAATKAIRSLSRPDAIAIPIIALTANAFDDDRQRTIEAGMNAHLSKPINPAKLYSTLQRLIKY